MKQTNRYQNKKQNQHKTINLIKKYQQSISQNLIQLPNWVQNQQFQHLYQYLIFITKLSNIQISSKQQEIIKFINDYFYQNDQLNNTKKLITIMRISDYLTMEKFQNYFIQQCVIKLLNKENCILYLQQTHKKLKNSTTGNTTSQAWYSLLNACIDFISYNLTQVYLSQPQRIQKLHQKILSQVLDRTIKYQVVSNSKGPVSIKLQTDNSKDKQIIFNLLMKSKKVNSVDALCNSLKSSLLHKKINKKMHAKLSWKLHDLHQITDKKVKNFKFLDLNWILQAIRLPDTTLKVKLTLLPQDPVRTQQSSNYIGVFYSKLYWNMDRQLGSSQTTNNTQALQQQPQQREGPQNLAGQQKLEINYICFKKPTSINIFHISNEFEQKILNRKLQLSIYCSIDQCYSFVINYIINDYSKLRLDQKKIQKDQIYALIQGSKAAGKYSQAVWLIKYLAKNQLEIPLNLLQNLSYQKLPTYQAEFIKKLVRNDNQVLDQVFGKKQINVKMAQIQTQINSLSGSKVSDNFQTKSNHSRGVSRGRTRKIFGESPQKQGSQTLIPEKASLSNNNSNLVFQATINQQTTRPVSQLKKDQQPIVTKTPQQLQVEQIMQICNLKNYFFDKNSPILGMI